jgi:hypothetical protein
MRLAFVHIPKTAGSYVKAALEAGGVTPVYLGNVHAALDAIANVPEVGDYYACAFVRHPADWLASLWAFRQNSPRLQAWSAAEFPHDPDWDTFASRMVAEHPGEVSNLFDEFTLGVDFVGSTPSVKAGLIQALTNSGIAYNVAGLNSVPPQNVGQGKPAITGPQRAAIEAAESAMMNRWAPDAG